MTLNYKTGMNPNLTAESAKNAEKTNSKSCSPRTLRSLRLKILFLILRCFFRYFT